MKKIFQIATLLIAFSSCSTQAQDPQKAWEKIVRLLQQEANYFQGKQGYIKLGESAYNTFTLQELNIEPFRISSAYQLEDRFNNEPTTLLIEEILVFDESLGMPKVKRAGLWYDYDYYFEAFPEETFLLIEFSDESPFIQQDKMSYTTIATGTIDTNVQESTTTSIILPIRSKKAKNIFQAIQAYNLINLKPFLDKDRMH
ncbi:hypothetical protein COR50_02780 [Chitinophaga caeni]|uniref:Uncharacterized protein n=1 Tax=Chitinophaga caeni TaxID=2029983 RepID=A0A291QQG9_9BACT|nr:hypothetical protein [Chitinophaga caeni]ATL46177.1 hypothetical protein COR50_02780 [Chitinophaga caeni]